MVHPMIMIKRFLDIKDALLQVCCTMAFKQYVKSQQPDVKAKEKLFKYVTGKDILGMQRSFPGYLGPSPTL